MEDRPLRKVRSFVRRPGRMTQAQRRALDTLLPRFGLAYEEKRIDLTAIFGREAPRVLDIGFGDGEAMLTTAAHHPDIDYVGVEIHEPGIGHLLLLLQRAGLGNVRIVARDVVDVVGHMLGDACIDAVNLFFPDPWPKKRHHKRRLVQPDFVRQCARILKEGGLMHIATDWANYAEHVREVFGAAPDAFEPMTEDELCGSALAFRPPTKFERRGRRLGHEVADLFYRRRKTGGAVGAPSADASAAGRATAEPAARGDAAVERAAGEPENGEGRNA